jgi:ElaB/YqjD/DUF883 family membrane-anchored ribosome-binding protein
MLTATRNAIQDNLNSQEAQNVREDVSNLKSDVSTLARHMRDDAAVIAKSVRDDAVEMASEKYSFFKSEGKKQVERMEAQVHAKPVQSIAIAFAAGAILALLARR